MTTSAERVAKDIVDRIFQSGSQWGEHDWAFAQEIIAEAITRAENDKLEEAAKAAERHITGEHSDFGSGGDSAAEDIADEIRSLKSKD